MRYTIVVPLATVIRHGASDRIDPSAVVAVPDCFAIAAPLAGNVGNVPLAVFIAAICSVAIVPAAAAKPTAPETSQVPTPSAIDVTFAGVAVVNGVALPTSTRLTTSVPTAAGG